MSQALLLRVSALESRMRALEERLSALEPGDPQAFSVRHRGRGKWGVVKDDTFIGTEAMTKDEAEAQAAELNEMTECMSA